MALLCSVMGHTPAAARHRNQGLEFAVCHHCACDLIRLSADGEWSVVPEGYRVVWRDTGYTGEASSVAARMNLIAPPARRRDPRNARPAPRRDPRGRPFSGASAMFGMLTNLGKLVGADELQDVTVSDTASQQAICLPSAAMH